MPEDHCANIRETLGRYIGERIVDITQHDADEWAETHVSYVALHLSNGCTLKFPVGAAGFEILDLPCDD